MYLSCKLALAAKELGLTGVLGVDDTRLCIYSPSLLGVSLSLCFSVGQTDIYRSPSPSRKHQC